MSALLTGYLREAMSRSFAWGVHDCATFVIGWAEAVSGGKAVVRPLPKTERGFLKRQAGMRREAEHVLGALGFETGCQPAMDGDIGFTSESSLALFDKGFWHGVNERGLTIFREAEAGTPYILQLWRHTPQASASPV